MKLQIKDSGAWRNIAVIAEPQRQAVMAAGADLLRSLRQPMTDLRIADGDQVIYRCSGIDFLWRPA